VKSKEGIMNDLALLTKVRLTFLVVVTTFIGYFFGTIGSIDWLRLY